MNLLYHLLQLIAILASFATAAAEVPKCSVTRNHDATYFGSICAERGRLSPSELARQTIKSYKGAGSTKACAQSCATTKYVPDRCKALSYDATLDRCRHYRARAAYNVEHPKKHFKGSLKIQHDREAEERFFDRRCFKVTGTCPV